MNENKFNIDKDTVKNLKIKFSLIQVLKVRYYFFYHKILDYLFNKFKNKISNIESKLKYIKSNNFSYHIPENDELEIRSIYFYDLIYIEDINKFKKRILKFISKTSNKKYDIIEAKKRLNEYLIQDINTVQRLEIAVIDTKKNSKFRNIDLITFNIIKTGHSFYALSIEITLNKEFNTKLLNLFTKQYYQFDVYGSPSLFKKIGSFKTTYPADLLLKCNLASLFKQLENNVFNKILKPLNGNFAKNKVSIPNLKLFKIPNCQFKSENNHNSFDAILNC